MLKRVIISMIVIIGLFGASIGWAMDESEIQQAINLGYKAAQEKQDFVYNQMDTDQTYSNGLFRTLELLTRGYIINAHASVANLALNAQSSNEKVDFENINSAANQINVFIVHSLAQANIKQIEQRQIVLIQGEKSINPINVKLGTVQMNKPTGFFSNGMEQDIGELVTFDLRNIDETKPIKIIIRTKFSKNIELKFNLNEFGSKYKFGTDIYKL